MIVIPPKEVFKHGDHVFFADTEQNRKRGIVGEQGVIHHPDWWMGLMVLYPREWVVIDGKTWPAYVYYFKHDIQVLPF